MKICTYCRTESQDYITSCKSCGSSEFDYICNNCRTTFNTPYCPSCGIKGGEQPKTCPTCATKSFESFCPKCGADLVHKDKKNSERPSIIETKMNQPTPVVVKTSTYKKDPHPLLTALIGIFVLGLFVTLIVHGSNLMERANKPLPSSALDPINQKGHPLYLDNYQPTKKQWKRDKTIAIDEIKYKSYYNDFLNDALVFLTRKSETDNIITNVFFNFSKTDNKFDLTLDEILKMVCDYVPADIVNNYYDFKVSFKETRKNDTEHYTAYYYVMTLNENGKKVNSEYPPVFAINIYTSKYIWSAEISEDAAVSNCERIPLGYELEAWDVDITPYLQK